MARWIKTDGMVEDIYPKGNQFSLEELQACVGGYIERIFLEDGRYMYINEDGHSLGLPVNRLATNMAQGMIVGNVIVTQPNE